MKRKSGEQKSGAGGGLVSKKTKTDFDVISFKRDLKEKSSALPALEKFIKFIREEENGSAAVDSFLKISGECNEIFSLIEGPKLPSSEMRIIYESLECILVRVADDLRHHKTSALHIVQRILQNHQWQLYSALQVGCTNKYIKSCLCLLTAMVTQDLSATREVQGTFNFQLESLAPIMNKRDRKAKEDVRICFIRFAMSFLISGDDQIIQKIIEVKGFFNGILREITKDRASSIHLLLTTLKEKVVCNSAISKTAKMRLFSENILHSLAGLYRWKGHCDVALPSEQEEEMDREQHELAGLNFVRQLVHDFLLTLTCSFKYGINFYDRSMGTSSKVHNNILLRFLLSLKSTTEDSLVEELVIKILFACPDLLNKYLTGCDYMYAPRLSDKWLANIELLMKIYKIQPDMPPALQVTDKTTIPKLVSMTMVTTVPVVATRVSLSQGIKSESRLVQFKTLQFITMILKKVSFAVKATKNTETVKMSGVYSAEEISQFVVLYKEAVCKILPEVSFILSIWHKLSRPKKSGDRDAKSSVGTEAMEAEDGEEVAMETDDHGQATQAEPSSGQEDSSGGKHPAPSITSFKVQFLQTLSCYQETLPEAFSQCGYDFSRLLHGIVGSGQDTDQSEDSDHSSLQYFLLRLLLHSSAGKFRWFKEVKGQGSGMYNLLQLLVTTQDNPKLQNTTRQLIQKILVETGLFEHSQEEIALWLSNLEKSSQGDTHGVIELFEKLLTRVVRNPYPLADRVIDVVHEATSQQSDGTAEDDSQSGGPRGLEAILSMEITMETPQKSGEAKSESTHQSTAWSTESFPFSTLVVGALQDWVSDNPLFKSEIAEKFLFGVLREVLHCQINPTPLCLLVGQIFTQSDQGRNIASPELSVLQKELMKYCNMFLPNEQKVKDTPKKKKLSKSLHKSLHPSNSPKSQKFADLLYESFTFDPLGILEMNKEALAGSIVGMETDEVALAVKQVILYARAVIGPIMNEVANARQVFQAYFTVLDQLYRQGKDSDCAQQQSSDAEESEDAVIPQDVVEIILTHPLCVEWFLPASEPVQTSSVETRWLSETVTEFVRQILEQALRSPGLSRMLIQPYVDKTFEFANYKLSKLAKKQKVTPSKLGRKKVILGQSVQLLTLLSEYGSSDSVKGLVNKFLQLPQSMIVSVMDDESDLTQEGEAMLTLLSSHSVDQQTFIQLVNAMQTCRHSRLDSMVLGVVKAHPQLVLFTDPETLEYCLGLPTQVRMDLARQMLTHSLAHRVHFEDWIKNEAQASLKLISDNKDMYLSVVEVFLKKGQTEIDTVDRLHQAYHDWLCLWLLGGCLDGQNDEETDKLKFSMWCRLVGHTNPYILTAMFDQLKKVIGSENKTWNRYQLEAGLKILQTSELLSKDVEKVADVKMAFFSGCLQCLCVLHKAETQDLQLEKLMHNIVVQVTPDAVAMNTKDFASVWNRFVKTGLRGRYQNQTYLQTLMSLIPKIYAVDGASQITGVVHLPTIYQMLLSHSLFFPTMLSEETAGVKETLVELMVSIVRQNPACCDSAHFTVLLGAYGATLSRTDQLLLCLMNIYENNQAVMWEYRPYMWGQAGLDHHTKRKKFGRSLWNQPALREVLSLLDKDKMYQTVLRFPWKRQLMPSFHDSMSDDPAVYDPSFLLPLFSHLLTPESVVDCRRFVEWHGMGVTIAALSSTDPSMRAAGYHVIGSFYGHLEATRFKEKRQILYLLNCLKNSITEPNTRLSSVIVIFISKVAQIFSTPEDPMYSMVQKFLLIKPEFNLHMIPQFQRLLFSSDIEHKQQQRWMLDLCLHGLKDQVDIHIYSKKCFVFKMLMAFFSSPTCDRPTKQQILKILESAVAIRSGAMEMSRYHGLLPWLDGQIANSDVGLIEKMLDVLSTLWKTVSTPKLKNKKIEGDDAESKVLKESVVSLRTIVGMLQVFVTVVEKIPDRVSPLVFRSLIQMVHSVILYRSKWYGECISERAFSPEHFIQCLYKYGETFQVAAILEKLKQHSFAGGETKAAKTEKGFEKEVEEDGGRDKDAVNLDAVQRECQSHLLHVLFCFQSEGFQNLPAEQLSFVLQWALQKTMEVTTSEGDAAIMLNLLKWVRRVVRNKEALGKLMEDGGVDIVKMLLKVYVMYNEFSLKELGNHGDTDGDDSEGSAEKLKCETEDLRDVKNVAMLSELNSIFADLTKFCLHPENSEKFLELRNQAEKSAYRVGLVELCSSKGASEGTPLQTNSEMQAVFWQELWMNSENATHTLILQHALQQQSGATCKPARKKTEKKRKSTRMSLEKA